MTTETEVTRFVAAKDAVTPVKTLEKAAEEANDYKFQRAGNGHYVCKHGDNAYVIIEKMSSDPVPVSVIGCSCYAWTNAHGQDVCKHVATFLARSRRPAAALDKRIAMDLIGAGWIKTEHGNLYPPSEEKTTANAAERQEEIDAAMDAKWNQKHPETATSEEDKPDPTPKPELGEKVYSRTCPHCDQRSEGTDLDTAKRDHQDHIETCPKNPKNMDTTKSEPTPKTKPASRMITTKCQWCGEVLKHEDAATLQALIREHEAICPKRPEEPEQEATVAETATVEPEPEEEPKMAETQKKESLYGWIENLIEYGVGQIFGDTGTGKTALCREIAVRSADEGKKVVYWDSEGNMTRTQRAEMAEHKNITYVLDRDWNHIKNMTDGELSKGAHKLQKCDLFILDSIGVPVLGIYGTLKQNQKGAALQGMQGLLYQLTVWAEKNEAVVIVTNQPVSEMNKTDIEKADRHPFGDKAMFFTKEILKVVVSERTEYKTSCHLTAWRSRSAGRGKMLGTVTISDKGVEIKPEVV